ncbi:hypothetical protein DAF77_05350 [Clostridioides difficile]|nr:hypothetical protein [Clostridioides difficile]EGT5012468.1 hypothetical protein [Clostridioides difficile]HBG5207978.1 hypothetical protein [Clostridioides difficile]HBG5607502.1 hypothetical protein [Clostridioides difficile]HCU2836615.1 hypothetical protein [Clostridioides difficile]
MKKLNDELKVNKIINKIEVKDMEINADPCKVYWEDYGLMHEVDCDKDCGTWPLLSPEASVKY